jgi:hypothetical protein
MVMLVASLRVASNQLAVDNESEKKWDKDVVANLRCRNSPRESEENYENPETDLRFLR